MGMDGSSSSGRDDLVHLDGFEEGLIALDVHDDLLVRKPQRLDRLGDPVRSRPVAGEVMTARPPKARTAWKIRSSSVATAAKETLLARRTRS